MARNIALGKTQSEAEEVARQGAQFMFGSYLPSDIGRRKAHGEKSVHPDALGEASGSAEDPVEAYVNDVVICGTPEKVIDDLQKFQETLPLDYLMCAPLSHTSFELFTEKVMPHFL
jgi:alkanesulfonate monooxygenase SsuD/methylene tetrahydromethanopterin reductase-like flavin-dependent oxidoreductase (luciferase family)